MSFCRKVLYYKMYLVELIFRWIFPDKKYESSKKFDPFAQDELKETDCEHVFLPVDSSGEILACSKCGLVINRKAQILA